MNHNDFTEEKLQTHTFIFDIPFLRAGYMSHFFKCSICKLLVQVSIFPKTSVNDEEYTYIRQVSLRPKYTNVSCGEVIIKDIIE